MVFHVRSKDGTCFPQWDKFAPCLPGFVRQDREGHLERTVGGPFFINLRAQSFRAELERAYRSLAEKVVKDLFLLYVPPASVYARAGIPAPSHTLEEAVQPSTKYFWTVRARFELDGQPRVTEWGVTDSFVRRLVPVPNPFSFRFKTPPE